MRSLDSRLPARSTETDDYFVSKQRPAAPLICRHLQSEGSILEAVILPCARRPGPSREPPQRHTADPIWFFEKSWALPEPNVADEWESTPKRASKPRSVGHRFVQTWTSMPGRRRDRNSVSAINRNTSPQLEVVDGEVELEPLLQSFLV
jgi:hypothetical protein